MAIKLPVWNNPYIGLPTLVAATLETYGPAGGFVLRESHARVGRMSASHLLDARAMPMNATASEWAELCGFMLANDGFSGISRGGDARSAWVEAAVDPYRELYGFLPSPAGTNPILWEWVGGMLSVASPALSMAVVADPITDGGPLRWRFDLAGEPVDPADRRPTVTIGRVTPDQQAWLNPLVRTYAVLVALIERWGADGEALAVRAYRRLGHEMGVTFMEAGIAPKGATAQQWGHVSDQIADENGLADHELIEDTPERYTTVMPACARYAVPLRLLEAPRNICDIPMNWDNGEMDVVADAAIEIDGALLHLPRGCPLRVLHRRTAGRRGPPGSRPGERGSVLAGQPLMLDLPLEPADEELVRAASDVLRRNFAVGRHQVGAAIRTREGRIYTGVHVGSRRINICAEEVTIGTALSAGERDFAAVASVIMMEPDDEPAVTSPCGVCREVLSYYGPDMTVVYLERGVVRKTRMADLLPGQWLLPSEVGQG